MRKRLRECDLLKNRPFGYCMRQKPGCHGHNCSKQSFYRCKAKFGGVEVLEAKRLRELERMNAELERMVAEQAPNIRVLKDVNSRKW